MEKFRTELTVNPAPFLTYKSAILTCGSCFADNIGNLLRANKFNVLVNPSGISYNPISIHQQLNASPVSRDHFVQSDGLWHHLGFHSIFNAPSKEDLDSLIDRSRESSSAFLKKSSALIITYGSAWVYRHKATNQLVANCHKFPARDFTKELLQPDDIVKSFKEMYSELRKSNNDIKIILTLSPVRHIKDNLELNQVGKSIIRYSIFQIQQLFPEVEYFPAYEIMVDDLRDYRFYGQDMIHPSDVAIEHIWNIFCSKYLTGETLGLLQRWSDVKRSLNHRPFNTSSTAHQAFLKKLHQELQQLGDHFNVSQELKTVSESII